MGGLILKKGYFHDYFDKDFEVIVMVRITVTVRITASRVRIRILPHLLRPGKNDAWSRPILNSTRPFS